MITLDGPEAQRALSIQGLQTQPVLLVHLALLQRRMLPIDLYLSEPRRLLGNGNSVVLKQVHDEIVQADEILLVRFILLVPLIIDIRKVIRLIQVQGVVAVLDGAVVLRGHKAVLHKAAPDVEAQERHGRLADVVQGPALLELGDAVVLAAKGDEVADTGEVAPLNVSAEELAALGEANGVDGRRGGEDAVLGQLIAYYLHLVSDVADEGGCAVVGPVRRRVDDVDEDAGGDVISKLGDFGKALAVGVVA